MSATSLLFDTESQAKLVNEVKTTVDEAAQQAKTYAYLNIFFGTVVTVASLVYIFDYMSKSRKEKAK